MSTAKYTRLKAHGKTFQYDIGSFPFRKELEKLYDLYSEEIMNLLSNKNHDYDEAWKEMRISSMTDIILMKLYRTKQIENNNGKTLISEGIKANYQDIVNYSVFCLIKLLIYKE